jgi:hypothetical protein
MKAVDGLQLAVDGPIPQTKLTAQQVISFE